jgi:hypothetical protein
MKSIMESNNKPKRTFGEGQRQLSTISRNYDLGDKGFLTDTEKQMRGMDSDNVGHLENSKVSAIVAETLALRDKTNQMKMWIGILGVAVAVLGLSNLGTAFAAAWLAKDTTVNESTGQLMVKDSDTPVTVQSTGQTSNLVFEESNSYGCMDREDAAKLWTGVIDGTPSTITIQEPSQQDADVDPTLQAFFALALTTNGATWNETMACMPASGSSGEQVCIDFTDGRCDAGYTDRALEVMDHHTRRKLFHAAGQGHRGLDDVAGHVVVNVMYTDTNPRTGGVNLGAAGNYVILSKAGISTVPDSAITGNIAVSPIAATAITGFSLTADSTTEFSISEQLTGKAYAANYGVPTPALLTTAVSNMEAAYTDAAGRVNPIAARTNLGGGLLGGVFGGAENQLTAGVYTFGTGVRIGSDIHFDGGDEEASVFIIQMTGNLLQVANTNVLLHNGAQAKNIFWQVSGYVAVEAGAHMEGILLAKNEVTLMTGSTLNGRVFAQTACILQQASVAIIEYAHDSTSESPSFAPSPVPVS